MSTCRLGKNQFARAYLVFKNLEGMQKFVRGYDGHPFKKGGMSGLSLH